MYKKRYMYKTKEESLAAVKENGFLLLNVENQDKEICLEAVKQDGNVLDYVRYQDKDICLAALNQNPYAFKYVKDLDLLEEILLEDKKLLKLLISEWKELVCSNN